MALNPLLPYLSCSFPICETGKPDWESLGPSSSDILESSGDAGMRGPPQKMLPLGPESGEQLGYGCCKGADGAGRWQQIWEELVSLPLHHPHPHFGFRAEPVHKGTHQFFSYQQAGLPRGLLYRGPGWDGSEMWVVDVRVQSPGRHTWQWEEPGWGGLVHRSSSAFSWD
jgi:hypothetical protein